MKEKAEKITTEINEKGIEVRTLYHKSGNFTKEIKEKGIEVFTLYYKSGEKKIVIEKNEEKEIINSYDESGIINRIKENDKRTGMSITTWFDESGIKSVVYLKSGNNETRTFFDKSGKINGVTEKKYGTEITCTCYKYDPEGKKIKTLLTEENKETGIERTIFYYESGLIRSVKIENNKDNSSISTMYDELGIKYSITVKNGSEEIITSYKADENINFVLEKNNDEEISCTYYHYNKKGNIVYKEIHNKTDKIIYSKKEGNSTKEYIQNLNSKYKNFNFLRDKHKLILVREIENLENNTTKIKEGNTITYKNEYETKIINYDSSGKNIISVLRKTIQSKPIIEELYEKGKLFPTFKVENLEVPLDSLDKYKELCQKYKISPMDIVLDAHKKSNSNIESFIKFFRR